MVLLYSREGQLANRLWQAAYFISNAMEYNYTLLHLGFAEYAIYFNEHYERELKKQKKIRIIDFETTTKKDRLFIKYANLSLECKKSRQYHFPLVSEIAFFNHLPAGKGYDISKKEFLKNVSRKILLVDGWQFMDKNALTKHAEKIRKIFKPNSNYLNAIEKLKQDSFLKFDFVVGVHIRRGDYSGFNDGKWFYSNTDYNFFMKQVSLLSSLKNKRLGFFLCSDEPICYTDFADFEIIHSTNHFVEDLYALSLSDLIIGPPSTYSSWAAFYGNTRLLHLEERLMKITEDSLALAAKKRTVQ